MAARKRGGLRRGTGRKRRRKRKGRGGRVWVPERACPALGV